MTEVTTLFAQAFADASKHTPSVYANLLRFIGVSLLFIACALAVNQFLGVRAKSEPEFLLNLTAQLLKLLVGATLIILLFKP